MEIYCYEIFLLFNEFIFLLFNIVIIILAVVITGLTLLHLPCQEVVCITTSTLSE